MGNSVNLNIIENKITVAAPYVRYVYTLVIKGYYATLELLQAGVTDPAVGDAYGVGSAAPYTIYIWDGTSWVDNETLKGEKGDPGDNTEWIKSTIDPTTEGIDGDLYLNYTTWHVWEKISGTWEDKGTIKGIDGEPGAPGVDGTDGDDGNTILSGTADPTTEGIDGDWYINRTTWHIWEKATGAWTDRGSIKGEDGGGVPAISTGDAGKFLKVNATETDTEWTALTATVPDASNTVKGVVKVGANVNVTDGVISVPDASKAVKGVIELATDAEVITGTDTERAITPAGLAAWVSSPYSDALNAPYELVQALGSLTTNTTIDCADGNIATCTIGGALSFTFTASCASGYCRVLTLIITNGGAYTITWPTAVKWADGTAPTFTASGVDIVTLVTVDAGTTWYGSANGVSYA